LYNKADCSQVSLKGLRGFFRAAFTIPDTQTLFDPQVIYDESSQRCFLSAESEDSGNTDQYQYFAVSKSSGCNSWYLYRVVLSEVALGTLTCKAAASDFWDYPKNGSVSANGGRWFITANLFPTSGTATSRWLFIDKTPTLTGAAPVIGCVSGAQINTIPPLVKDTNATAYFLSPGSNSSSAVQRYIHVASPTGIAPDTASGTTAITIPSWTAPPAAPQPNGVTLDTIDGRFQGQTQQIGTSLWNVHAINVGGFSRIWLYQFSTTGTSPLFTFTPTTVAGNNDHLFNPSVAVNAASNLAFMSVSRTIPMDVTNGKAAMLVLRGPSNSTSGWVTNIVKISNTQFTGCTECRWGDHSATQLDPSNPTRAWGFNQIVTGSSQYNWSTRAAKVN